MTLNIQRLHADAILPTRAHENDAGLDLASNIDTTVGVRSRVTIGTGIAIALPAGTAGLIYPRSGLASRYGLSLSNSVGVIDSDYRGEVMLTLINHGTRPFTISKGMRVAQMIVTPYCVPELVEVDHLDATERGTAGIGSSGK